MLYKLTKKEIDLLPVIIEINLWAEKYFSFIPEDRKALLKEVKKDKEKFIAASDGFVYVSEASEFEEGRAKIFCIDKERIAVYKHENELYAIHNVCKHQGGPLGEGKILDGCITCPWHGYQYLPHNGQSPPPFTEKVSTYDVRVNEGKVFLNPKPYAEGTERSGAMIN